MPPKSLTPAGRARVEALAELVSRECDQLSDEEHAEFVRLISPAHQTVAAPARRFCGWSACLAFVRTGESPPIEQRATSVVTEAAETGLPGAKA
jgi:hypothetical protein